ncbi:THxN family PEP-CTERM protein [Lyngbya sp. PCC 8106]|uniref:THxN family PEP-CTERM protein n=1 Tax=Lyngbya sp. (strain PCC 8106) TaxID=313612 RepID=UPI0000EAB6FC|nr:THxN family PEP-CTERM protein [Lyngbya sp. PCC 8106]EAW33703.1 probable RTX (repeat in structural toxin) protein [Lyngbya sp. PCC 8106]
MFSKPSVNLLLTSVFTSAFALVGTAANALTLNGSSGSWSNPIDGNFIQYQTIGEDNQIRWGNPVTPGKQSGLGFTGIDSTDIELENVFQIGILSHFNNVIYGNTAASAVNLSLDLDFAELGLKTFDFNLEIDETPNSGNCPYVSTKACSDKISFPTAFSPESFEIDGVSYTLSLVGFSYGADQSILSDFISQEYETSEAILYGKITAVENLTAFSTQPGKQVSEPQTLGGILALGLILTNRILKRDWLK